MMPTAISLQMVPIHFFQNFITSRILLSMNLTPPRTMNNITFSFKIRRTIDRCVANPGQGGRSHQPGRRSTRCPLHFAGRKVGAPELLTPSRVLITALTCVQSNNTVQLMNHLHLPRLPLCQPRQATSATGSPAAARIDTNTLVSLFQQTMLRCFATSSKFHAANL